MEQYIPKSAVVAEIERRIAEYKDMKIDSSYYEGMVASLEYFRDEFINTFEVKEVDLEAEIKKWRHNHFHGRRDKDTSGEYLERISQLELAKHFFELGLHSTITEEDCKLIWNIGDDLPYMPEEDFFKELLQRYNEKKKELV